MLCGGGGGAVKFDKQGVRTPIISAYTFIVHTLLGPVVLRGVGAVKLTQQGARTPVISAYTYTAHTLLCQDQCRHFPEPNCLAVNCLEPVRL